MSLDTFPAAPSQPRVPENESNADHQIVLTELQKLPESGYEAYEKIFSLSPSLESLLEAIKSFNSLPESEREIPHDPDRTLEERNNSEMSAEITVPGGFPVSISIDKDGIVSLSSALS